MNFLYNEKLALVNGGKILFDGIKLWVKGQGGEKIYLNVDYI